MAIEYNWEILSLYTAPSESGLENVVKKINWRFQATDGQYYGDSYEVTELSVPSADGYIAYDDLTEETIVGWIKANRDYDDLVSLVNERLQSNKTPSIVEKNPPWEYPIQVDGTEEYLVVVDDQPNDLDKIWGPLLWDSAKINKGLVERGIEDVSVPDDMTVFRKGLFPVDEPLVLSDRVKIYRVGYAAQPEYDEKYQTKSDLSWVTETGRAVGTYFLSDKTIDVVKDSFKEMAQQERNRLMYAGTEMELNGETVSTYTDTATYLLAVNKANDMSDSDTVKWKLVNSWIVASKSDLLAIANFIDSKMQEYYDQEYAYVQQIDACTTMEELQTLYNSVMGE